jgi:hypothetical protein
MSEAEFERLLDAVRTIVASAPTNAALEHPSQASPSDRNSKPTAANDNRAVWRSVPSPDGSKIR